MEFFKDGRRYYLAVVLFAFSFCFCGHGAEQWCADEFCQSDLTLPSFNKCSSDTYCLGGEQETKIDKIKKIFNKGKSGTAGFGKKILGSANSVIGSINKIGEETNKYWGEKADTVLKKGKVRLESFVRDKFLETNETVKTFVQNGVLTNEDLDDLSKAAVDSAINSFAKTGQGRVYLTKLLGKDAIGKSKELFTDGNYESAAITEVKLEAYKGAYALGIDKILNKMLIEKGYDGDVSFAADELSKEFHHCLSGAASFEVVDSCLEAANNDIPKAFGAKMLAQKLELFNDFNPTPGMISNANKEYNDCSNNWFENKKERESEDISACVLKGVFRMYLDVSNEMTKDGIEGINDKLGVNIDLEMASSIIDEALNDDRVQKACPYSESIKGELGEDDLLKINVSDLPTYLKVNCKNILTEVAGEKIVRIVLKKHPKILGYYAEKGQAVPDSFVDKIIEIGYGKCMKIQKELNSQELDPELCANFIMLKSMDTIIFDELKIKLKEFELDAGSNTEKAYSSCIDIIETDHVSKIKYKAQSADPTVPITNCLEQTVVAAGREVTPKMLKEALVVNNFTAPYATALVEEFGSMISGTISNCLETNLVEKNYQDPILLKDGITPMIDLCQGRTVLEYDEDIVASVLKKSIPSYYSNSTGDSFKSSDNRALDDVSKLIVSLRGNSNDAGEAVDSVDSGAIESINDLAVKAVRCYRDFGADCPSLLNDATSVLERETNSGTDKLKGLMIETGFGRRLISMETSDQLTDGIEKAGTAAGIDITQEKLEGFLNPIFLENNFFNDSFTSWNKYRELIKNSVVTGTDLKDTPGIRDVLGELLLGNYLDYYKNVSNKKDIKNIEIDLNDKSVRLIDNIMGSLMDAKVGEEVANSVKGSFFIDGVIKRSIGGDFLSIDSFTTWDAIKESGQEARKYFVDEYLKPGITGRRTSTTGKDKKKKMISKIKWAVWWSSLNGFKIQNVVKTGLKLPYTVFRALLDALSFGDIEGSKVGTEDSSPYL